MSISRRLEVRVRMLLRRRDGYIALTEWRLGDLSWTERVGPFAGPEQVAVWLADTERETIEIVDVTTQGELTPLATFRVCGEHVAALSSRLFESGASREREKEV